MHQLSNHAALRAARLALLGLLLAAASSLITPAAQAAPPTIAAMAAGFGHTCALTTAGAVLCWGANQSGELGDSGQTDRPIPAAVSRLSSGVTAIAAGQHHSCALTTGGGVLCWGANSVGQLGDGTIGNRSTPVAVIGLSSGVTAIAAGNFHTCALTAGGSVLCWGFNSFGQLGDGTTTIRTTPVPVSDLSSGATAIAAGQFHTCAAMATGGVRCWGDNSASQLGDGTTTQRLTPVAVSGLSSGVTAIALGFYHTCALTAAGGVLCWGDNGNGELGDGTTTPSATPVAVSGLSSGVATIAAGYTDACALTAAGGVLCWGFNFNGQLGDGTTTQQTSPVAVSGLDSGVTAIAAGGGHTCALTTGGAPQCWGNNAFGQLGDGTTTQRLTPVAVQFALVFTRYLPLARR
jgi:alpha-tubulin suppressor-like RCC1 family protein